MTLDELYGLGAENYRDYEKRILAVDVEKVRAVAQRILRFDAACVALLGPNDAVIPL
jgi:predicted Zn-dependent peptidase